MCRPEGIPMGKASLWWEIQSRESEVLFTLQLRSSDFLLPAFFQSSNFKSFRQSCKDLVSI